MLGQPFALRGSRQRGATESPVEMGMILNARDVTSHQEMLRDLQRSEQLFHAAFNATATYCTITDMATGEFIDVNDPWVRITGWSREEAVGQLTGSIAHDLNNMLTVVLGQIDLSINKPVTMDGYQQTLATIRHATWR